MARFRGSAEYSIDSKGRVAIPARMRAVNDVHTGSPVVINLLDGCIMVYLLADWEAKEDELNALNSNRADVREVKRLFLEHACDLEVDAQGRLALPKKHLDYAGLSPSSTALIVGAGMCIELWNPERFERRQNAAAEPLESQMERTFVGGTE